MCDIRLMADANGNGLWAGPGNLAFMEGLYETYLRDPNSLAEDWRHYFSQWEGAQDKSSAAIHGPTFAPRSIFNPSGNGSARGIQSVNPLPPTVLYDRVHMLIRLYRMRGHRIAQVNPLGLPCEVPPELKPEFLGLTEADMDIEVKTATFPHNGPLKLRSLLERLQNTYCRSIGAQYMHIDDLQVRRWLQRRMESCENRTTLTRAEQIRILTRLTDAVTFEEFIRKKFVGAKTFSLEGSESLIPLLDLAIEKAGEQGIKEIIVGMAHRGRLNVLANVMGKSARQIFREFADAPGKNSAGRGDVKYHLGYSSKWKTAGGKDLHLSLCFNPSHLEFVNTVVQGRTRAKQDRFNDSKCELGMALLIHGDASFAGQGVVQETLNLSQLKGYHVGGTLHVIVNNQLGFTTDPEDARSCTYPTDIAKVLQVPIFHVNGEAPEAVAQVVKLAMDFRWEFKRDVVINMYGYRRLGHNEGDEPSFTQPLLYKAIEARKPVREGYLEHLLALGEITQQEANDIAVKQREVLEKDLSVAQSTPAPASERKGIWAGYEGGPERLAHDVDTGVATDKLKELLQAQCRLPEGFTPHPKIKKFLEGREQMAVGERGLDWAAAEALAFATLACEGVRVRLSGQDSQRGTFSQRHSVLHDFQNGKTYTPLQNLPGQTAPFEVFNSPLSEAGVLGFDYGYSIDYPTALVLWEAQYGDFWNGAQPIVDQFIVSAEDKWQRLSGLVLLLPHGLEGAGPEHSSARIERFLQLAADDNIQVVYPTTPAQYFHCLRRQMLRRWRKPLIVMTPKSLLRDPRALSSLEALGANRFEKVLPDPDLGTAEAKRILLGSGKVYYDLAASREQKKATDFCILRLEQVYPFPLGDLEGILKGSKLDSVTWVQEEPANMGVWPYLRQQFGERLLERFQLKLISRPASATPAAGSNRRHKQEQADIMERAFADETLVTLESDKATVDLPAPASGTVLQVLKKKGELAKIGEVIARMEANGAGSGSETAKPAAKSAETMDAPKKANEPVVMPAARRALAEKKMPPESFTATGPGGRLLKEDVQRDPAKDLEDQEKSTPEVSHESIPNGDRTEEVVPMSRLRRTVAERLVQAQKNAALLTTFNEIDMTEVMALRRQHGSLFEERHKVRLGLMSFFVKAAIDALKQFPGLNSEIRGESILYRHYFDIGVAIGGGKGLVVPVVRNAERLSFAEIETTIGDFARRAKDNKLKVDELQGGTFTISNGGVYGSLLSTPIVNPPQSGVLGLHAIQERPVAREGQVVIRPMMYIALTYDHRIVDGREAVLFLKRIKEAIETPARMLLEV